MKKLVIILMIITFSLNAQNPSLAIKGSQEAARFEIQARNEARNIARQKAQNEAKRRSEQAAQNKLRPYVILNIKYKGVVYKNYQCKVLQIRDFAKNYFLILTDQNTKILVQVGKSSKQKALDALDTYTKHLIDEAQNKPSSTQITVRAIIMQQNLLDEGCLVRVYDYRTGKKKLIYINESYDVADGEIVVGSLTFSIKNKFTLTRKGLYRYSTTFGTKTVEEYILNK